jgi:hypothetical protein
MHDPNAPIIPPPDFVARFNAGTGQPPRTAIDPVVMAAWHYATDIPDNSRSFIVTGI